MRPISNPAGEASPSPVNVSPRVVFAGPLPPPVHGMASVNAHMLSLIAERAGIAAFGVQPPALTRGLRYHFAKAVRVLGAMVGIARARLRGARTFYGSVDDSWGGLWTILLVLTARLSGLRIFLHHHSFRYILDHSRILANLARIAGAEAIHVVLCEEMGELLRKEYPGIRRTLTVPNAVPVSQAPATTARPGEHVVTIGILSNLTAAKGLHTFLEIFGQAVSRGLDIRGILAGPIVAPEDEALVLKAIEASAGRLEWRGPVHGAAKERFFQDIDLFVFPTTYRSETFSLVLVEALIRGVSVAAPRRGCICELEALNSAHIIALDRDFVRDVLGIVADLVEHGPAVIAARRSATMAEGLYLNRKNAMAQARLADLVAADVAGRIA